MDLTKYFGTFTAAGSDLGNGTAAAMNIFKFEYLTTLGIAAIVIFLGRWFVKNSAFLRKYAIPAPVVSGLLFSVFVAVLKMSKVITLQFTNAPMQDLCQNVFFMCVGYSFSAAMAKKAGKGLLFRIGLLVILLTTMQDVVGVLVGKAVGFHPLLALQCSSAAMSGGVGTAAAFGPQFESMGAAGATSVGAVAGTLGNIMGSLVGGPVGVALIRKYSLKPLPGDADAIEGAASETTNPLVDNRMVVAFASALLITALGLPIYSLLKLIPKIEMPKFIGCLFAGAIARNLFESRGKDAYIPEMTAIEHMFLELYLALVLMNTDVTVLFRVAGQMGLVLLCQMIFMGVFAYFITFRVLGRNYGAAVMAAGNCGWGLGAGPNALANEKAVMDVYGWHSIAWVVYPSLCLLINNCYNSIFLSVFGSMVANW